MTRISRRQFLGTFGAAAGFVAGGSALAEPEYDVPFVPTPPELVEKMLDLAEVGASDFLIDLGCGDGRIAIAAARRGARALGVDIDPTRIESALLAAQMAGVEAGVRFRRQDLFRTPIYEASVIALYLLPEVNLRLRPRLMTELRPGSRIVSHAFDMGDWRPEAEETHDGRRIFLWIVPAVAGGSWEVADAGGATFALEIEQRYQEVTGTLTGGGRVMELREAVLRGTRLRFTVEAETGPRTFSGTIDGAAIVGDEGWRARRLG